MAAFCREALGGGVDRGGWRADAFRIVSACILIAIVALREEPANAGLRAGFVVRPSAPVTATTVEHPIARGESFARILGRYGIPAGMLLGEVVSFDDADRNGEWEAVVAPLRDLDSIVSVYVCVRSPLPPQVAPREDSR